MTTHVVSCPCGWRREIDGFLDAREVARLHNRSEAHDASIEPRGGR